MLELFLRGARKKKKKEEKNESELGEKKIKAIKSTN